MEESTAVYRKDKSHVVAWMAAALGGVAIAAVIAAHGKIWSHEISIEKQADKQAGQEKRLDSMDSKLDRILDELRRRP
jgi:hypothetical protein